MSETTKKQSSITDWITSAALVVLAVVAIVWTIELVQLQSDIHDALEQAKGLIKAITAPFEQLGGNPQDGSHCSPDPTTGQLPEDC